MEFCHSVTLMMYVPAGKPEVRSVRRNRLRRTSTFITWYVEKISQFDIPYSRKLLWGFKFGKLVNFFTKSPKLVPPNTRTRIIVRNGVVCGAHVFGKIKFINTVTRYNLGMAQE